MNLYDYCALGIGAFVGACICLAFHALTRPPDPPHITRGGFGNYFRSGRAGKLGAAFHSAAS